MKKIEIELPDGLYDALNSDIDKHFEGLSIKTYVEYLVISHIINHLNFVKEKDLWKK